jgi:hypothetical protein
MAKDGPTRMMAATTAPNLIPRGALALKIEERKAGMAATVSPAAVSSFA